MERTRNYALTEVNARLSPFSRRRRRILAAVSVSMVAIMVLFVSLDYQSLATHSLSTTHWFDLLIVLGVCGWLTSLSIYSILRRREAANQLVLGDNGFELAYPSGKLERVDWLDPSLSFKLIDCSHVNPSKLLSGVPHSIVVHGVQSELTADAYSELMDQISRRGLADSVSRGSRWIYDSDATPMIHRVRARPHHPVHSTGS